MTSATMKQHSYSGPHEAAEALATVVADDLRRAIEADDRAVLAVSGGPTPKLFFQALSLKEIAWEKVVITLVDERWVPDDHDRSNARLVKDNLLQGPAAAATFVPLYQDRTPPEAVAAEPPATIADLLAEEFSVVVLGLGPDGHTASFFPDSEQLAAALDLAARPKLVAVHAPSAGEPRMTFSAAALLRTKSLYLQIEGPEIVKVFEDACEPGPVEAMPIRVFLQQTARQLDVMVG